MLRYRPTRITLADGEIASRLEYMAMEKPLIMQLEHFAIGDCRHEQNHGKRGVSLADQQSKGAKRARDNGSSCQ